MANNRSTKLATYTKRRAKAQAEVAKYNQAIRDLRRSLAVSIGNCVLDTFGDEYCQNVSEWKKLIKQLKKQMDSAAKLTAESVTESIVQPVDEQPVVRKDNIPNLLDDTVFNGRGDS